MIVFWIPKCTLWTCDCVLDTLLLAVVRHLDFVVNLDKSELVPMQRFVFMGITFNLVAGRVYPTEDNVQIVLEAPVLLLGSTSLPARQWLSILGVLGSQDNLIPLGRMGLRPLQWHLQDHWNQVWELLDTHVPVPPQLLPAVQWWTQSERLL